MSERWRKPMKIVALEPTNEIITVNGRRVVDVEQTIDRDSFERMCEGYLCPCGEPCELPYPKNCAVCGFPMRAELSAYLERNYGGTRWVGPRETIEDEFARMDELNERARKAGIVLPPGTRG